MNKNWHLAQMNVAHARFQPDDHRMRGFMEELDNINALAEASPGFVWRLQSDSGNATDILVNDDPLFLINMSVWQDVDSLFDYVYKSAHRQIMIQRRQWFEKPENLYQVLWWIPGNHEPTPQEGLDRLKRLQDNGPTKAAFGFRSVFPPPDTQGEADDLYPDPYCSGWD